MLNTADEPDNIEFVSYHDINDDSKYEFVGNHKEVKGDRLYNYSQMWNECQKIAEGPLYMYQADDIQFLTKGWDTKVKEVFDKSKDKIEFVYFNDQHQSPHFACIYCIHKNWVDTVGYLTPPYFSSHRPDNWVNDVARHIDRRVYLEDVIIKHIFINTDQTHLDYVKRKEEDSPYKIYADMRNQRKRDRLRLLKFIKNYGS